MLCFFSEGKRKGKRDLRVQLQVLEITGIRKCKETGKRKEGGIHLHTQSEKERKNETKTKNERDCMVMVVVGVDGGVSCRRRSRHWWGRVEG